MNHILISEFCSQVSQGLPVDKDPSLLSEQCHPLSTPLIAIMPTPDLVEKFFVPLDIYHKTTFPYELCFLCLHQ